MIKELAAVTFLVFAGKGTKEIKNIPVKMEVNKDPETCIWPNKCKVERYEPCIWPKCN